MLKNMPEQHGMYEQNTISKYEIITLSRRWVLLCFILRSTKVLTILNSAGITKANSIS